jgi:osmotically inducible protein OsmC
VDLSLPADMGGEGGTGTNPEQLFAVGYAACFASAIGGAGRREHIEPGEVTVDSNVSLHANQGGSFGLSVELAVTLADIDDPEIAKKLVATAHEVCPYSNATRGNVEVTLTANGQPV